MTTKISKLILITTIFISAMAINQTAYAETHAEFKARLLKIAGPLGPFAMSEDFPKSYFLISKNLPFMVGLTLGHPMKTKLGLTKEQVSKIKEIKKNTVPVVAKAGKKIKLKEIELANKFIAGASVDDMAEMVEDIAEMRTKLTKKHLVCIDQVRAILTTKQFKILQGYAGKKPVKK